MRRSRLPYVILGALVPLAFLVLGIYLGGHPSALPGGVRDALVDDRIDTFDQGLSQIEKDYYRKVSADELTNKSLGAAVESLDDRFSHYFSPKDFEAFQRATAGEFSGVGMNVAEDKRGLKVAETYPGSPARKAGIKPGDLIVAVNGRSIAGQPTEAASAKIKGKPGTPVALTILSGKDERVEKLERATITVPIVRSRLEEADGEKVAYVQLGGFSDGAARQLRGAIDRRVDQGAKAVVLDLRGNGGGLLREAVAVSSIFLPEGPIVSTDGRSRERKTYRASGSAIGKDIPVIVLVNENSASASEIVAGALQDRRRAKLVGTRTFGKGVFQEIEPLPNGGALDITVGEYFLPSGRNLGGGGVKKGSGLAPDVKVTAKPRSERNDPALRRALGELDLNAAAQR